MSDDVTAEEKAEAHSALRAARQPGSHSTKHWKPYRSGFCRVGAPEESHALCRGEFGTNTVRRCTCDHHIWTD